MQAVLWRDYLCPWCHLGRDRSALLSDLGVTVMPLAYELHPDVPEEGRPVGPDGRFAAVLAGIAEQCAAVGLAFRVPRRIPNTRHALETVEVVRVQRPDAFAGVDAGLYDAQWVHGRDLGDPAVVDEVLAANEVDPAGVGAAVRDGVGARAVEAAMAEAREHGVTGTPAWWLDDRLLVPGVQPRESLERWVRRLQERRSDAPRGGPGPR